MSYYSDIVIIEISCVRVFDPTMQLFDLARDDVDLIKVELDDLPNGVRHLRPCVVEQFDDLLEMSAPLGDDQPEFREMATDGIDQLGALADWSAT